jgi:hypothetical protein
VPTARLSHIAIGLTLLAAFVAPLPIINQARTPAAKAQDADTGTTAAPAAASIRLGSFTVQTKAPLDLARLPASAFGDWDSTSR